MNGRPDELQDQEADAERARVLREEIAELRLQVERAAPRAAAAAGAGAQPPAFIVQDRFALRADDGTWELTIEAPTPIFAVVLSADVSVDLLEVQAAAAILSQCKPDPENGRATLATYRCQDSVSRLVIPMRCPEGQPGTLRAFVLPKISPKTSVEVQHRLRPLCLHGERCAAFPPTPSPRRRSTRKSRSKPFGRGAFSDAHIVETPLRLPGLPLAPLCPDLPLPPSLPRSLSPAQRPRPPRRRRAATRLRCATPCA